jgi:hypothetical protein
MGHRLESCWAREKNSEKFLFPSTIATIVSRMGEIQHARARWERQRRMQHRATGTMQQGNGDEAQRSSLRVDSDRKSPLLSKAAQTAVLHCKTLILLDYFPAQNTNSLSRR